MDSRWTYMILSLLLILSVACRNTPKKGNVGSEESGAAVDMQVESDVAGNGQTNYECFHDTIVNYLRHPLESRKLYFHHNANITVRDSFSVIGVQSYSSVGDDRRVTEYAIINHDKNSKGHKSFTEEYIREWRDRSMDSVVENILSRVDSVCKDSHIDSVLMDKLKGFWVPLIKYQGEYYVENDWATLVAYELTDSTWMAINMENFPEFLLKLEGSPEHFTLLTNARETVYSLIDPEREIYQFTLYQNRPGYLIPVRKANEFEIIEYMNTSGDLTDAFIRNDED